MKRTLHSLSHYKLASMDMGRLVPVACFDVLPGDSIQHVTSALVRASPLLAPVMHPVTVRMHHWFVPYRLVWENWEDFITGGPDGNDASAVPYITLDGTRNAAGTVLDYFGLPTNAGGSQQISAMPMRAYNLIFNEFYRDQDLVTALTVNKTDGADNSISTAVQQIAWEKDYFTAARTTPQKGDEVTLPLGTTADVDLVPHTSSTNPMTLRDKSTGVIIGNANLFSENGTADLQVFGVGDAVLDPNGRLMADLSTATSVDVNTVRLAFAMQRYQEARSLYGSRYSEYLRYLGVRSSDARLQRPEYLGGGKQTISFTEVLQTAPTTSGNEAGVADLKGHGIAGMRSRRYRRFFEEHGVVISLMSMRPKSIYSGGIHRMWSKTTKEDYWQKELEHIGQQEVYNKELYANGAAPTGVFGYQDRYAEYRSQPSDVVADFRSTLADWHFARVFGAQQTLNGTFVTCTPSEAPFAASSAHTMWCMIRHSIKARRLVSNPGIGRIL